MKPDYSWKLVIPPDSIRIVRATTCNICTSGTRQFRCVEKRTSVRCGRAKSQKGGPFRAETEDRSEISRLERCHCRIPTHGAGTETHVQSLLGYVYPQERAGCLYEAGYREQTGRPTSSLRGYWEVASGHRHGHPWEAGSRFDQWRRGCRARTDQRSLLHH